MVKNKQKYMKFNDLDFKHKQIIEDENGHWFTVMRDSKTILHSHPIVIIQEIDRPYENNVLKMTKDMFESKKFIDIT